MVYERLGGGKLHGMQTFYSFTHDRQALEVAVVWSDAFLHARNDPVSGRVMWTGKRELCWPNKEAASAEAAYSGAENGDVIEHIVNTAKLILESPELWDQAAPTDTYSYGKTYLERAKTYVRECQKSAETTIVPWYLHKAAEGYRLIRPDVQAYVKSSGGDTGPLPWNQQQCVVGGLLRLAQCHRLLKDGDPNIETYEQITRDAAAWFFDSCRLVKAKGKNCYQWSYMQTQDPLEEPEDTGHSFYDVYVFRAYEANLGPSRLQMQRLINTARFIMYLGPQRHSGIVNGTSNERRYERKYLNYGWIEMAALDRAFYREVAQSVLTSHQYYDDLPVEAAVLKAKHYWASAPPEQEVVDDVANVPEFGAKQAAVAARWRWRLPAPAVVGMIFGFSELLLTVMKRSRERVASKDRHTVALIWIVDISACALGVIAAYRLGAYRMTDMEGIRGIAYCIFALGLAIRWYSVIYLGRYFTVNVAIAGDHQLVETGPYRFVRHPSYTGALLALFGFALSLTNWVSLLLVMVPCCTVILWRIRIEERALSVGLGEAYRRYVERTWRLVPLVY